MNNLLDIINKINIRSQIIQEILIKQPITNSNLQRYAAYKQLHGPSSLILYMLNGRLLLFFRDVHIEPKETCGSVCNIDQNNCIWISDFFKNLFSNAPMCIDFFCETTSWLQIQEKSIENKRHVHYEVNDEKLDDRIEGLMKTKTEFIDCLSPFKTDCTKYKTTRFHNIEFRRFALNIYNLTPRKKNFFTTIVYYLLPSETDRIPKIDELKKLVDSNKYDNTFKTFIGKIKLNIYRTFLEALLNNDIDSVSKCIMSAYNDINQIDLHNFNSDMLKKKSPYPKIFKQISVLKPEYQEFIKKYIMKRYDNQIVSHINEINKCIHYIDTSTTLDDKNTWLTYLVKDLDTFYFDFAVLIFDTYTIGRLMKSIFNYNDSSLILSYAGGFHIQQYEDFFIAFSQHFNLKCDKIIEIGKKEDENGCIQLDDKWITLLQYLQGAFNKPSKCTIKEGIPFGAIA